MGTGRWFWSWQAALVAVCVGATVSACGAGHAGDDVGTEGGSPVARTPASHAATGDGVVPWAGKRAPKFPPVAAATPTLPVAKFGLCDPAHLTAHAGEFGMGAGSSWHSIVLANTGTQACTLKGGPSRLAGIRADGSTKTLAASAVPASAGNLIGPANLQPGQSARVELITSMNCPASQAGRTDEYAGVGIGVGAGEVRARFTGDLPPFDAICGVSVTGFGVPGTAADVVSSPLDVLPAGR